MADKKLNEVTKVTDMAYVPVIMSDGSIGQIAKADLASVVAGVITPGVDGSGIKSFEVAFNENEPQTITLGGGLLFVRTIGGQSTEFYAIDYWSTNIEKIAGGSNPLFAEVSKSANSGKVIFKTAYKRTLRFLFLGE